MSTGETWRMMARGAPDSGESPLSPTPSPWLSVKSPSSRFWQAAVGEALIQSYALRELLLY